MHEDITESEARLALGTVAERRRQVLAQIDMPAWYWWAVGMGWIALGIATDVGPAWLALVATLVFGAVHAAVAHRVLSGRHGSSQLSVRADEVSRHVPLIVVGYLLALAAATVVLALLADADHAGHPVAAAGVVVGVAVIAGGPRLMAAVSRRAQRAVRP
jgi:hypothetical protein